MKRFELFRPEDFGVQAYEGTERIFISSAIIYANAKLNAWLEAQPVVYGDKPAQTYWTPERSMGDTHTARLVCIEPLVQESEERKLLRELVDNIPVNNRDPDYRQVRINRCISRARKLLGEG